MDDLNGLVDPRVVPAYFAAMDPPNTAIGAERNIPKSVVTYYCTRAELEAHRAEWGLDQVAAVATVRCAEEE
eukprot:2782820-Karenia_brevis.AAC.1